MPLILIVVNGVGMGCRASAHSLSGVMLGAVLLMVVSALVGGWRYRRNRRSVKSILLMFQLSGWPFAVTLTLFMWNVSYLTGTHGLYAEHSALIVGLFAAVLVLLSLYHILYWSDGRQLYRALASYIPTGEIPTSDLYNLLTFQGRATRMRSALPVVVGISASLSMVIARLLERSVWDLVLFALMTLALTPYVMAVLIARLWFQKQYLRGADLVITDR